ncbi:MAG: sensor domain-containing diguanylate cyclase [Chloroflexi bacterium]|nr:sensor domain-containing diguanylate cyclase [Chloroflexota bacterium]
MKKSVAPIRLTITERQNLALPGTIAAFFASALLIVESFRPTVSINQRDILLNTGVAGILYILVLFFLLTRYLDRFPIVHWGVVVSNAAATCLLLVLVPSELVTIPLILDIIILVTAAIISGRWQAYVFLAINTIFQFILIRDKISYGRLAYIEVISLPIVGLIIVETILRLQKVIITQLKRLETSNNVARSLATSLATHEVLSLLSASIQNAFAADTYYIGFLQEDHLRLELLYDEGDFYSEIDLPLENTLTGWIFMKNKSLLVHNLAEEAAALGISPSTVGKPKISLSWMGTPIRLGRDRMGMVAVGSYSRSAFNQGDLELLENVAQQAALAILNTYQHAEVERQTHLDSLTGVYNHGYFLKVLDDETAQAAQEKYTISLIMLDIDYFKQYNDRYGHLAGDQILSHLTANIREHIKSTDSVGRWGGEEFVILLPHTDCVQALLVAERIRQSMNLLMMPLKNGSAIPSPTVSQGVAIYPHEADEMFALIDLADQRLYKAKERGRNQIEAGKPISELNYLPVSSAENKTS